MKSKPVLANENLVSSMGKMNAGSGAIIDLYSECQNGNKEIIGILLIGVFVAV